MPQKFPGHLQTFSCSSLLALFSHEFYDYLRHSSLIGALFPILTLEDIREMLEILKFVFENADRMTVVTVLSLIVLVGTWSSWKGAKYIKEQWDKREKYLMDQIAERDKTIASMTDILLRTNDTLGKLTSTIDSNKKELVAELRALCVDLQIKIKDAIIAKLENDTDKREKKDVVS